MVPGLPVRNDERNGGPARRALPVGPMSISEVLTDLFQTYPRLSLASGDMATYRGMRRRAW